MGTDEKAVVFPVAGESLVGVVSVPEQCRDVGVVVIVGGPQYRAGSHRQFVLLARQLAKAGFPVLRFDYRGMGDSTGDSREFQAVQEDIGAAIACLQLTCPSVRKVVLWGLCDAASAALLYCAGSNPGLVGGLCLLNPWVRSEETFAQAQVRYYYGRRLFERAFWVKLLRGGVSFLKAVREAGNAVKQSMASKGPGKTGFQERMLAVLVSKEWPVLLILSGRDLTAREFEGFMAQRDAWSRLMEGGMVQRVDMPEADHTFSCRLWRGAVERATLSFLDKLEL